MCIYVKLHSPRDRRGDDCSNMTRAFLRGFYFLFLLVLGLVYRRPHSLLTERPSRLLGGENICDLRIMHHRSLWLTPHIRRHRSPPASSRRAIQPANLSTEDHQNLVTGFDISRHHAHGEAFDETIITAVRRHCKNLAWWFPLESIRRAFLSR